jgi:hypothetical protein
MLACHPVPLFSSSLAEPLFLSGGRYFFRWFFYFFALLMLRVPITIIGWKKGPSTLRKGQTNTKKKQPIQNPIFKSKKREKKKIQINK